MKTILKVIAVTLLSTQLTACLVGENNSERGGGDHGGGNIITKPLSVAEAEEVLIEVFNFAEYLIRPLEQSLQNIAKENYTEEDLKKIPFFKNYDLSSIEVMKLYDKLFVKNNILKEYRNTQLKLAGPKESCVDSRGKQHDGSAIIDGYICLDPKRIAKLMTDVSAYPIALGIIAHELSHKLGANEREAQNLELIFRMLGSRYPIGLKVSILNLKDDLYWLSDALNSQLNLDLTSLCTSDYFYQDLTRYTYENFDLTTTSAWGYLVEAKFHVMQPLFTYLQISKEHLCNDYQISPIDPKKDISDSISDYMYMPHPEFARKVLDEANQYNFVFTNFQNINQHRHNLLELQKLIEIIRTELDNDLLFLQNQRGVKF